MITGMNLLHFTCKFGAKQIGHEDEAVKAMNALIAKGMRSSSFFLERYELFRNQSLELLSMD
jgi:hypothetical protein